MEQQNKSAQEFEVEIDIREVFFALLQKWYIIGMVGFLTAVLFMCVSMFLIPEKFESNTSMYILTQDTGGSVYSDFQLGTILTKDYEVLVKSRTVLEQVAEKLDLDITYGNLKSMVSVSVPESTRIVEITVRTTDPELSWKIADSVREVASKKIADVMNVDAVNVVEKANLPTIKCSPSVTRNTILGGFIGVFLSCAVILLFVMFNDTIRTQDDVEKYLGVCTLGVIPLNEEIASMDKKNRKDKKRSKKDRN